MAPAGRLATSQVTRPQLVGVFEVATHSDLLWAKAVPNTCGVGHMRGIIRSTVSLSALITGIGRAGVTPCITRGCAPMVWSCVMRLR
eukprot:1196176-Prorocentrum_minimum.AAC.3